jgi:hypothetical protein
MKGDPSFLNQHSAIKSTRGPGTEAHQQGTVWRPPADRIGDLMAAKHPRITMRNVWIMWSSSCEFIRSIINRATLVRPAIIW